MNKQFLRINRATNKSGLASPGAALRETNNHESVGAGKWEQTKKP
jgi:hypothetical protein